MRWFALLMAPMILVVSGCAAAHYSSVKAGTLKGRLTVEWIERDRFVFVPDQHSPLTFTRASGTVIVPERMETDGGSIPRPLWAFRSYSPWGYAPAFIVHDWLFVAHRRGLPEYEDITLEEAALVMSEIIKTMMERKRLEEGEPPQKFVMYSMYLAVKSSVARRLWEGDWGADGPVPRPAVAWEPRASPSPAPAPSPPIAPPPREPKERWVLDFGE